MHKTIGLITDFGLSDSYVGVMKGVILTIDPEIKIIDISHSLPPFSILSASYLLYTAWDYFPEGTVFLSVVDPGVGGMRRTIVYSSGGKFLVTPDNGTISMLERMNSSGSAVCFLSAKTIDIYRIGESATFHGRDIFAPIAARIAKEGAATIINCDISDNVKKTGPSRNDETQGAEKSGQPVILDAVYPEINIRKGIIRGRIIHIDHFGNCITSIHYSDMNDIDSKLPLCIKINGKSIYGLKRCFSDVQPGRELVYTGSSGFLEIAVRERNAAAELSISQNQEVFVHFT